MIELSSEDRIAGGRVIGRVTWPASRNLPEGRITVWLVWRTSIKRQGVVEPGSEVNEDYAVVAKRTFAPARSIPFEFAIPPEGPVTHAGELFGVDWDIVVGTEEGRKGLDVLAARGFVVACRPAATAVASYP